MKKKKIKLGFKGKKRICGRQRQKNDEKEFLKKLQNFQAFDWKSVNLNNIFL